MAARATEGPASMEASSDGGNSNQGIYWVTTADLVEGGFGASFLETHRSPSEESSPSDYGESGGIERGTGTSSGECVPTTAFNRARWTRLVLVRSFAGAIVYTEPPFGAFTTIYLTELQISLILWRPLAPQSRNQTNWPSFNGTSFCALLQFLTSLELLQRQFAILPDAPESTHGQDHRLDQGLYPTANQLGALALVQTTRMEIHQLTDGE